MLEEFLWLHLPFAILGDLCDWSVTAVALPWEFTIAFLLNHWHSVKIHPFLILVLGVCDNSISLLSGFCRYLKYLDESSKTL